MYTPNWEFEANKLFSALSIPHQKFDGFTQFLVQIWLSHSKRNLFITKRGIVLTVGWDLEISAILRHIITCNWMCCVTNCGCIQSEGKSIFGNLAWRSAIMISPRNFLLWFSSRVNYSKNAKTKIKNCQKKLTLGTYS